MSKSKNQNKNNNKSSKVPVKSQPMKPQKGAVIKPNQVASNKNNQKVVITKPIAKPVVKPTAKAIATNKKQAKPIKKDADIEQSDEDEDEEDIEFDSDIDDVDLGDSGDEDMDDEDDDLSIEEIDGSDLESFEDGDSNDESEDDEEKPQVLEKKEAVKVVEKKEAAKAVEKKEAVKVVEKKEQEKAVEKKEAVKKVEKKEAVKVVEKKEQEKAVEKKEAVKEVEKKESVKAVEKKETVKKVKEPVTPTEEKIIDPTTKEGKLLTEINKRKNYFNDVVLFITKVPSDLTRENLVKFFKENNLSIITINLPGKMKKKGLQLRGYGFARFANVEDAKKALELINSKEINGKNLKASFYICRKVYNDINKINFFKLIVQSFIDKDLSEIIGKHFKNAKITKYLTTQYGVEFSTKEEANKVFNEETVIIDGNKLIFNYLYAEKSNLINDVAEIPEIVIPKKIEEPVVVVAKETVPVKAGVKRNNCESSSDEEEEIIKKKTKMNDGTEAKVEKKVLTPKKPLEKKISTPQNNNNKDVKKDNKKSPANGKANFNKSPLDKKQFNNKNNKQSPAGNKGKNSPGNKKFNKK